MASARPKEFSTALPRIKVVAIGDGTVGKTALLGRYATGSFRESYLMTIGSNFFLKQYQSKNSDAELQLVLWDTAGQERFRSMMPRFYEGAKAVVIVYDLTARQTFDNVGTWFDSVTGICPGIQGTLVGNKTDLATLRVVSHEDGQVKADELGFGFVETSAKTGSNVEELFADLAEQLLVKHADMFRAFKERLRKS